MGVVFICGFKPRSIRKLYCISNKQTNSNMFLSRVHDLIRQVLMKLTVDGRNFFFWRIQSVSSWLHSRCSHSAGHMFCQIDFVGFRVYRCIKLLQISALADFTIPPNTIYDSHRDRASGLVSVCVPT